MLIINICIILGVLGIIVSILKSFTFAIFFTLFAMDKDHADCEVVAGQSQPLALFQDLEVYTGDSLAVNVTQ